MFPLINKSPYKRIAWESGHVPDVVISHPLWAFHNALLEDAKRRGEENTEQTSWVLGSIKCVLDCAVYNRQFTAEAGLAYEYDLAQSPAMAFPNFKYYKQAVIENARPGDAERTDDLLRASPVDIRGNSHFSAFTLGFHPSVSYPIGDQVPDDLKLDKKLEAIDQQTGILVAVWEGISRLSSENQQTCLALFHEKVIGSGGTGCAEERLGGAVLAVTMKINELDSGQSMANQNDFYVLAGTICNYFEEGKLGQALEALEHFIAQYEGSQFPCDLLGDESIFVEVNSAKKSEIVSSLIRVSTNLLCLIEEDQAQDLKQALLGSSAELDSKTIETSAEAASEGVVMSSELRGLVQKLKEQAAEDGDISTFGVGQYRVYSGRYTDKSGSIQDNQIYLAVYDTKTQRTVSMVADLEANAVRSFEPKDEGSENELMTWIIERIGADSVPGVKKAEVAAIAPVAAPVGQYPTMPPAVSSAVAPVQSALPLVLESPLGRIYKSMNHKKSMLAKGVGYFEKINQWISCGVSVSSHSVYVDYQIDTATKLRLFIDKDASNAASMIKAFIEKNGTLVPDEEPLKARVQTVSLLLSTVTPKVNPNNSYQYG